MTIVNIDEGSDFGSGFTLDPSNNTKQLKLNTTYEFDFYNSS
jgi:hypothetical protein